MNKANLASAYLLGGSKLSGLTFLYPIKGKGETLEYPVMIYEKRTGFGRVDVLIGPVGGAGRKWVAVKSLGEATDASIDLS